MIGYIKGSVLESAEGKLIVAVGGAESAVGYAVSTPNRFTYSELLPGSSVQLFIHTHVREDALDLYGFLTAVEKEIFLTLLSVNGIGPKGALGILSGSEPSELVQAIINGDKGFLTQIPGIGKKTAERVVIELSDSLAKKSESGRFHSLGGAGGKAPTAYAGEALSVSKTGTAADPGNAQMIREAKTALIGLGYREHEVAPLLSRVLAEADVRPRKVEDLIKKALQQLA